ncbi:RiPP maturation radical SAM C-methyltransferase [Inquilinus sp. CA228]|uniref:RiPP maturation radical SAM C-methyltransferase n=1 Tax=Inquilinus sp. CA228 TaxID=3455609 RepID=UPI003F8D71A8
MRIQFVVMPWNSIHYPSLGMGILTAVARRALPTADVGTRYANLRWVEFMMRKSGGALSPDTYKLLGEDLFFQGVGEWVFTPALYDADEWCVEGYREVLSNSPGTFDLALQAHRLSREFVEALAQEIADSRPDVVGLTNTFMQSVPCLALARRLKALSPQTIIIMGGGNCDGVQGETLHRNYPFIDYVVRGEGEAAFEAFLAFLDGHRAVADVPGLCWRQGARTRANPVASLASMDEVPTPVFDDYFQQCLSSPLARFIQPNIVLESARGCWWGQKHHCTFCGLNGSGMAFRSKKAERVLEEIDQLTTRHGVLDIIMADNIIPMEYFKDLLPELGRRDRDLKLHYEVKSNLRYDQIELLRDAGVWHIQPGIESLSSKVLRIMDKGVTAPQNVRVLRDFAEFGMTTSWNILVGFPGETEADYAGTLAQMPALVHLQPPASVNRIAIERFSPYFNRPDLGFPEKRPAAFFNHIFALPETELADMVYLFDSAPRGVSDKVLAALAKGLTDWRQGYAAGSVLTHAETEDGIVITDRRIGWGDRTYMIDDPLVAAVYRMLRRPTTANALLVHARREFPEAVPSSVEDALAWLSANGLLFADDGLYVALTLSCTQISILREAQKPSHPGFERIRLGSTPAVLAAAAAS